MLLIALLLFSANISAGPLLEGELEDLRSKGFDALFNMQYSEAKAFFEKMQTVAPEEPAGHIYMANAVWLGHLASLRRLQTNVYNRNDSFFDEKANDEIDPKVDREFRKNIDHGMELAEASLKKNKKDKKAMYYLGIARNMNAGYEATVKRSFFSALKSGSKGVGLHRDLLKLDPSQTDAYLSVGMYEYVVGSLPLAVKIMVFLGGVRGSKKDGLQMLEKVSESGIYAKDEARVLLVMLYNREKRLNDALQMLKLLSTTFPRNFLFRLEYAMTLAQLSQLKASSEIFAQLLSDKEAMDYMPDLIHYQYAEALSRGRLWKKAHEQYVAAYGLPKAPLALKTMAHLGAGKCMDALGERDQAIAEYEIVSRSKKAFDAQDQASQFRKKPFTPE